MQTKLNFKKITACLDMSGCPNRCKHCWLGHAPNHTLSQDDLTFLAQQFRPYTDNLLVSSWYREPDYRDDYKKLWELENKLSTPGAPTRFELLSIWRIARDKDYLKWAKKLGTLKCQLTLFGLEEKTDYYTGRKGAFKDLIYATEALLDNGMIPRWQIFINKDNIDDMTHLMNLVKELKLDERCQKLNNDFVMFMHQGSCDGENRKLKAIRINSDDIKHIPNDLIEKSIKHCGVNTVSDFLGEPENILYKRLINDKSTFSYVNDTPVFNIRSNFNVYPNISETSPWFCLGNLKSDGIEEVLHNYVCNKSLAQKIRSSIPLNELVNTCGNPLSDKLFTQGDYITYLLNEYCEKML